MMDIQAVKEKLQEARSCLGEMLDYEQRAFGGGPRTFDQALSGFLGAGRSVDYRLQYEFGDKYRKWRKAWDAQHLSEDRILESMHKKRDTDVHQSGSGRDIKSEKIKVGVGSSYTDKSGSTLTNMGSPSPQMGVDLSATISKPRYVFNESGTERPVTKVCAEYLVVLEQMVGLFEADELQP
jgi:hypothetical protein